MNNYTVFMLFGTLLLIFNADAQSSRSVSRSYGNDKATMTTPMVTGQSAYANKATSRKLRLDAYNDKPYDLPGGRTDYDLTTSSKVQAHENAPYMTLESVLNSAARKALTRQELAFYQQAITAFGNSGSGDKVALKSEDYQYLMGLNNKVRHSKSNSELEGKEVIRAAEVIHHEARIAMGNGEKEANDTHSPKELHTAEFTGPPLMTEERSAYDLNSLSQLKSDGKPLDYGSVLKAGAEKALNKDEVAFYTQAIDTFGSKGSGDKLILNKADYEYLMKLNDKVRRHKLETEQATQELKKAATIIWQESRIAKENGTTKDGS
jgi:hypothetical protein